MCDTLIVVEQPPRDWQSSPVSVQDPHPGQRGGAAADRHRLYVNLQDIAERQSSFSMSGERTTVHSNLVTSDVDDCGITESDDREVCHYGNRAKDDQHRHFDGAGYATGADRTFECGAGHSDGKSCDVMGSSPGKPEPELVPAPANVQPATLATRRRCHRIRRR